MIEIKVFKVNKENTLPEIIDKGEWIDLRSNGSYTFKAPYATMLKRKRRDNTVERTRNVVFDSQMIDLGVAMEIPKGYEAILVPRSSTFKKYGIMQVNSEGIIDGTYCGEQDVWKMPVVAFGDTVIPNNERIAQFRIQLSQKATILQKIKWLFSNKVKIVEVEHLDNEARQGFGEGTKDIK